MPLGLIYLFTGFGIVLLYYLLNRHYYFFANKTLKRVIKSIEVDREYWDIKSDAYEIRFENKKNGITLVTSLNLNDIKLFRINDTNAKFYLEKSTNKSYILNELKRIQYNHIFTIKISTEDPEDFLWIIL